MIRLSSVALAFAAVFYAACSAGPGGTGGGGGAAGGAGGGGGAGAGGGTAANPKRGIITLFQASFGSVASASFSASGALSGIGPSTWNCTTSTVDGCDLLDCLVPADAGAPQPVASDSAGDITISGTLVDAGIKLTLVDAGYYTPLVLLPTRIWAGGETLTASAAGATIPVFSATVVAPNDITLTAPVCSNGCGTLSTTSDLNVAWTGGARTNVDVQVSSYKPERFIRVLCRAASSPATVTSAALARVIQADDGGYLSHMITATPSNTTTLRAGGYDIEFRAEGLGTGGSFFPRGAGGGGGGGDGGLGRQCTLYLACATQIGGTYGSSASTSYGPTSVCVTEPSVRDACEAGCKSSNQSLIVSGLAADAGCTFGSDGG